jgi:hypothetical protein
MVVSLDPQGTFVTGTNAKPVTVAQYRRCLLCTCFSTFWRTKTCLFHARLSTYRIRNRHQTITVTTSSHRSCEMAVSLGPQGTLVTGMKTESVTVKLTSETRSVNLCLLCLDEMRRICFFIHLLSLYSRRRLLSTCVSYISMSGPGPGAHRLGLVTGIYTACYIVGMFVTGFPNEARYSLISVCNEL